MKIFSKYFGIFLSIVSLALVIFGFFYFETSLPVRVMVILLGLLGLATIKSSSEILVILIFYLGLYDLYNIRYGLAVPLSIILMLVFGFSVLAFELLSFFQKMRERVPKNIFLLYLLTIGLIVLEIFLAMTFWPVDPKIKGLVIVIIFYILYRLFYLYINNVLNLKKATVFIFFSILILSLVLLFNFFLGF